MGRREALEEADNSCMGVCFVKTFQAAHLEFMHFLVSYTEMVVCTF